MRRSPCNMNPRTPNPASNPDTPHVIVNGNVTATAFPCTIETFLTRQKLPPRSVVVELNGEAVVPSEFSRRMLQSGDRLEIVKIVAGG